MAAESYSPEEASLPLPVPRGWVHEVRLECAYNNATDIVDVARNDHGLDSEASGWKLSDEGVAYCYIVRTWNGQLGDLRNLPGPTVIS